MYVKRALDAARKLGPNVIVVSWLDSRRRNEFKRVLAVGTRGGGGQAESPYLQAVMILVSEFKDSLWRYALSIGDAEGSVCAAACAEPLGTAVGQTRDSDISWGMLASACTSLGKLERFDPSAHCCLNMELLTKRLAVEHRDWREERRLWLADEENPVDGAPAVNAPVSQHTLTLFQVLGGDHFKIVQPNQGFGDVARAIVAEKLSLEAFNAVKRDKAVPGAALTADHLYFFYVETAAQLVIDEMERKQLKINGPDGLVYTAAGCADHIRAVIVQN